jgi:protocatechuate 3,4-dioxygenase, beta subunit
MDVKRRLLLQSATAAGLVTFLGRTGWADNRTLTPSQTKGPFYPIPEIEKQEFFDVDLTRKGADSPIATGKIIAISGIVVGLDEQPLKQSIVEVWQACETGRYNHTADKNDRPLDPNFQYWGRIETNETGEFRFKTILPGKYPGRTPHIHFRIVSGNRPELVTQLYFADHADLNRKDSIYMALKEPQRESVTTAFEDMPIDPKNTKSETIPTGRFTVVMGDRNDTKSTPPM